MKVLVVSFDRSLADNLKEALKDFEVIVVKNGEEAINTAFPDIDIVVYDAISGAISESDINRMYKEKFKQSKYVILVDSLFPIDVNNIEAPKKVIVDRESGIENIVNAVVGESTVQYPSEELSLLPEYSFETQEVAIGEHAHAEEPMLFQDKTEMKKLKVLVVTFDGDLINKLSFSLGDAYDIVTATNKKEILEKASDADIVVFDAMYGSMTQKILSDISKEDYVKSKPFIILVDDLFPIDTDSIPLPSKYTFARESEYENAVEQIKALTLTPEKESLPIQSWVQEIPQQETLEVKEMEEETVSVEDLLATLMKKQEEKIETSSEIIETHQIGSELEKELVEHIDETFYETKSTSLLPSAEETLLKISEQLEKKLNEVIYSSVSQAFERFDLSPIGESLSSNINRYLASLNIESLVREEINRVISSVNVEEIIKEETRKILREKLEELIT